MTSSPPQRKTGGWDKLKEGIDDGKILELKPKKDPWKDLIKAFQGGFCDPTKNVDLDSDEKDKGLPTELSIHKQIEEVNDGTSTVDTSQSTASQPIESRTDVTTIENKEDVLFDRNIKKNDALEECPRQEDEIEIENLVSVEVETSGEIEDTDRKMKEEVSDNFSKKEENIDVDNINIVTRESKYSLKMKRIILAFFCIFALLRISVYGGKQLRFFLLKPSTLRYEAIDASSSMQKNEGNILENDSATIGNGERVVDGGSKSLILFKLDESPLVQKINDAKKVVVVALSPNVQKIVKVINPEVEKLKKVLIKIGINLKENFHKVKKSIKTFVNRNKRVAGKVVD